MSGHTPGPWKFGERLLGSSLVVALAPALGLAGGRDEQRANARLMAASPELADALEDVLASPDCNLPPGPVLDRALAALKKARG